MIEIEKTIHWIQSFVIKLNLCPFAKREMDQGSVRIESCAAQKTKQALQALMQEITLLESTVTIETTFLIFPSFLADFFDYLDFVDAAESALITAGYEGVYQLATFHPLYCFADVDMDDVTNYTNRSPYPMLHILREQSLDKAIAYYGDTDEIPENNQRCLRELGLDKVKIMSCDVS